MTTVTVSNAAQLSAALSVAQGGDTIDLAYGNYGDVALKGFNFASDVTITSQSAAAAAVLNSLTVTGSSHIHIDDVLVNVAATPTTFSFSPAVKIDGSQDISFTNSTVVGADAIVGVAEDATALDKTGNVIGRPAGYGLNVIHSSNIVVDHNDVSNVNTAVVLVDSDHLTLSNNNLHDMRKSGIVGAGLNQVTVDSNHIHDSNPWHWGSGDHADFLALWTDASLTAPSTGITITNNLMEQGKGAAILGMWLQGSNVPFTQVTISNNAFLDGNSSGIGLWGVSSGAVDHNVMLQTSGDSKSSPGIRLNSGVQGVTVTDNITNSIVDASGSTGVAANTIANTVLAQHSNPLAALFYGDDLIKALESGSGGSTLYETGLSGLTGSFEAAAVAKQLAAEAVQLTTPGPGVLLTGSWASERLVGTGGADTINASTGGADTLIGGAGDDTYYASGSQTVIEQQGQGIDTIITKGDYTLPANVENLTINQTTWNNWAGIGNALNNVLTGNSGGNRLDGGAGNDTLIGGAGNDILIGGSGKDLFKFAPGSGDDKIADFSKTDHDVIDISAFKAAGLAPTVHDVGADAVIDFSNGDSITLVGVHASSLIATASGFTI
jgi:Ca2+-binding RTX toxin-like protein